MDSLKVVEVKGVRVLTSKQLAQCYEAEEKHIKQNFANNRNRFIEGKHYIALREQDLRMFKNKVENFDLVGKTANKLFLWTEKGALLHAKSLNTDKAWEVYDYLVDFYFRAKEKELIPEKKTAPEQKPYMREVVDVPENPQILKAIQKIRDDLTCMDVLLQYSIRYTEEKVYKNIRSAAAEVLPIIVEDWNKLFDAKPKLIQKQY